MKKTITSFALALMATAVLATSSAFAAGESNCQIIYGGGQVCSQSVKFTINKLVQNPGKGGEYVDNLTANDNKYTAGKTVSFKIIVTNTGSTTLTNLSVVDTFPQHINFSAGAGSYDAGNKKLSFTVPSLAAGKSQEFVISGKVVDEGNLPSNAGITCVTNTVRAVDNSGATAEDASQVCIQKNVFGTPAPEVFQKVPVKQVPATGPELYSLIALIPTGLAGVMLRRKSSR